MTNHQKAFALSFIKRARHHGLSEKEAIDKLALFNIPNLNMFKPLTRTSGGMGSPIKAQTLPPMMSSMFNRPPQPQPNITSRVFSKTGPTPLPPQGLSQPMQRLSNQGLYQPSARDATSGVPLSSLQNLQRQRQMSPMLKAPGAINNAQAGVQSERASTNPFVQAVLRGENYPQHMEDPTYLNNQYLESALGSRGGDTQPM